LCKKSPISTNLSRLDFILHEDTDAESIILLLETFPNAEELSLSNFNFMSNHKVFAAMKKLTKLTLLDIPFCRGWSGPTKLWISTFGCMLPQSITHLTCYGWEWDELEEVVRKRRLYLAYVRTLLKSKYLPNLECCYLREREEGSGYTVFEVFNYPPLRGERKAPIGGWRSLPDESETDED